MVESNVLSILLTDLSEASAITSFVKLIINYLLLNS